MYRLAHDLLDKLVIDNEGRRIGRVDGIIIERHQRAGPRIIAIECGIETLAERLHCGTRLIKALARRLGIGRGGQPARIKFEHIEKVGIDVRLTISAEESGVLDWEDWMRRHIIEHLPGHGTAEDENAEDVDEHGVEGKKDDG